MSDTLGSLIDKLFTVDHKLWVIQDVVGEAASKGEGLDAETVQRLQVLNLQRNRLMTEIDECFNDALQRGAAEVDPHIKIFK